MKYVLREMTIEDYQEVYDLWSSMEGLKLEASDSKERIKNYLSINQGLSFVAMSDNKIVGTVLSGSDGRRGYLYHLCVKSNYRKHQIGSKLLNNAVKALSQLQISEVRIFVFKNNTSGIKYWKKLKWKLRDELSVLFFELN